MPRNTVKRPRQTKNKKYMLVRYGRMNTLGFFEHHETKISKTKPRVVIKTDRGLELGYLVGQLTAYKGGQFKLSDEQILDYYDDSGIDFAPDHVGKFIRYACSADVSEERHLRIIAQEEMECCILFYVRWTSGFSRISKKSRSGIPDKNRNASNRVSR